MKFILFDFRENDLNQNEIIDSLSVENLYKVFNESHDTSYYLQALKRIIKLEYNFIFNNEIHPFFKQNLLTDEDKRFLQNSYEIDFIIPFFRNIKVLVLCINSMYCSHLYFEKIENKVRIVGFRCLIFTINHEVGVKKINNLIYKLFEEFLIEEFNVEII